MIVLRSIKEMKIAEVKRLYIANVSSRGWTIVSEDAQGQEEYWGQYVNDAHAYEFLDDICRAIENGDRVCTIA